MDRHSAGVPMHSSHRSRTHRSGSLAAKRGHPWLFLAGLLCAPIHLAAQCEQQVFRPTYDTPAMRFGSSVALDGSVAAVGAPYDFALGYEFGSVEVFHRSANDWNFEAQLVPSAPEYGAQFGFDIDLDGDRLVVGAPGCCIDSYGMAYVFRRVSGRWIEEAQLMSDRPQLAAHFGRSVAIEGNRIIVGAPNETGDQTQDGRVYEFAFDGAAWSLEESFRPLQSNPYQQFGFSVDLSGDHAVVGAPFDNTPSNPVELTGAAYVFHRLASGWIETDKLVGDTAGSEDLVGWSVAIDHQTIVVGAPTLDTAVGGLGGGGAFVFETPVGAEHWSQKALLVGAALPTCAAFGGSMSIDGDTIVVGYDVDLACHLVPPIAHVFRRHGSAWAESTPLVPQSLVTGDGFADAVGIDGDWAVVGAPWKAVQLPYDGEALAFTGLSPVPAWPDLGGGLADKGDIPQLTGRGFLSAAAPVRLQVTGALPGASAILVVGFSQSLLPLKGGTLVPTADVVLCGFHVEATGDLPIAGHWPAGIQCGVVVAFQTWIQDPAGPSGWTASNAIESVTR